MEIKTAEYSYEVVDGQNVTLSINSGNASLLRSIDVVLQENGVLADQVSQASNINIGAGQAIRGLRIRTLSLVADASSQTNRTSVTYRLNGGTQTLVQTENETVDDFGTVLYITDFIFV